LADGGGRSTDRRHCDRQRCHITHAPCARIIDMHGLEQTQYTANCPRYFTRRKAPYRVAKEGQSRRHGHGGHLWLHRMHTIMVRSASQPKFAFCFFPLRAQVEPCRSSRILPLLETGMPWGVRPVPPQPAGPYMCSVYYAQLCWLHSAPGQMLSGFFFCVQNCAAGDEQWNRTAFKHVDGALPQS
jgi:hypothetical protein